MKKSAVPVPCADQEPSIPAEGGSGSNDVVEHMELSESWNRMQDKFLIRARDAVERAIREKSGISPQELLQRMAVLKEGRLSHYWASKLQQLYLLGLLAPSASAT